MKLIICEKPDQVKPVAANRGALTWKNGYYEGNGYFVTSGFGHLIELFEPEDYDEKYSVWKDEDLPIIPDFRFKPKDNDGVRERLKIIKELISKADSIINGCDADREGENIFWLILLALGKTNMDNVFRIRYSDLNDEQLGKAFEKIEPISKYKNVFFSASARQKADWLYGMNLTRLMSIHAQSGTWIYGRVQTPTLMLVCDAFIRNRDFVETPFFKAVLKHSKGGISFHSESEKMYEKEDEAKMGISLIGNEIACIESVKEKKNEGAPLLFTSTDLQKEAYKRFGFKPDKTLALCQELYEKHKLVTYPRTDSPFLASGLMEDVVKTLKNIEGFQIEYQELKMVSRTCKVEGAKVFNDGKVGSHHGIMPTFRSPEGITLKADESQIYELILARFISAFLPPCEKEVVRYLFEEKGLVFKSTGSVVLVKGWKIVDEILKGTQDEQPEENSLPDIAKGERVSIIEKGVVERKTKKPPLLNYSSLLDAMATCGKLVEDEEERRAMSKNGIGTEATRAVIIKKIEDGGFIQNTGKSIIPTPDGLALYQVLKPYAISSPQLTGKFELMLNEIAEGNLTEKEFLSRATQLMTDHFEVLKMASKALISAGNIKEDLEVKCPVCKDGQVLGGSKRYMCSKSDWKKEGEEWVNQGCNFGFPKKVGGKIVSSNVIKDVIKNGRSKKPIKGLKNKEGKAFTAWLGMDKEYRLAFVFENQSENSPLCPKCKEGKLSNKPQVISCISESCDFVIFKKIAGKTLSDETLFGLIKQKKTEKISGFKAKSGKSFSSILVLDSDWKVQFKF